MPNVWTHSVWRIKPGREEEFVEAWGALVPVGQSFGGGDPKLLRDREEPNVFISVGPWPDLDAIERFRAELAPRAREMGELVESLETSTLDEAYPAD